MAQTTYRNPIITAPDIIYTVRHGQSIGNARGMDDESLVNLPNHQFPLTERGHSEMALSAKFIRDNNLIKISTGLYTSSFLRAQESMESILEKHEGDYFVAIDSRLDEWWKGIFHSLSKEEISNFYPSEKATQEREGWHHYRPPQGCAGKDVEMNLISFLEGVPEKEVLIVGHGRSLAFLRRLLTNQPVNLNCEYPLPKNAEIWVFTRGGEYYDFKSLYIPELK
jgi:broad specificity phosphatase PhoE